MDDPPGAKREAALPSFRTPRRTRHASALLRSQRGVTYLMLMFSVVLMGVALTAVGQQWSLALKRDREAELAFRGNRIKTAIQRYAADYEVMKATRAHRYPLTLEQLTQTPKRYLPVVYKDPMTGQDFEVIKVGAEIRGVKSRSKDAPLDQVTFKRAATYDQIAFRVEGQAVSPRAPAHTESGQSPADRPLPRPSALADLQR